MVKKLKLVCLKHPKYDGSNTPNLLCKACCSIYVEWIKLETQTKMESINGKTTVNE
jgi:hypothetical protein